MLRFSRLYNFSFRGRKMVVGVDPRQPPLGGQCPCFIPSSLHNLEAQIVTYQIIIQHKGD